MPPLTFYDSNGHQYDADSLLRRIQKLEGQLAHLTSEVRALRAQRMQIGTPRTQPVPYPDLRPVPMTVPPMYDLPDYCF